MDLKIEKKVYKKKKINPFIISIGFLIFSIILTIMLYFYNISLLAKNNEIKDNIDIKQSSIIELQKDSKIVILGLCNMNKNSIEKLEDYSRITLYIKHLIDLKRKYNINFKGFKYSNWELSTEVVAKSDSYMINYKKVAKFIKEYRKNEDLSALFNLNLVKNILSSNDWIDNSFNITLTLKNNISKILKDAENRKLELEKNKKLELERIKKEAMKKKRQEFLIEQQKKVNLNSTNSGTIIK